MRRRCTGEADRPVEKLADSKKEYAKLTPKLPFSLPAGDMYTDRNLKPTPVEVLLFLDACNTDPEIDGAVMWSMDQKNKVPELWDAYSRYDWDTGDDRRHPVTSRQRSRFPCTWQL